MVALGTGTLISVRWRWSKDVRTKFVARDFTAGRCFDNDGVSRWYFSLAQPSRHGLGTLDAHPRQCGLGFENAYGFLNWIHGSRSKQHVY